MDFLDGVASIEQMAGTIPILPCADKGKRGGLAKSGPL
jgi:hypothetical protein